MGCSQKKYDFLLSVVKKLESLQEGLVCFSYQSDENSDWQYVALNDYDFYRTLHFEKKTSNFLKVWRKASEKLGFKIIFCYQNPIEKKLLELANSDNLIMNI